MKVVYLIKYRNVVVDSKDNITVCSVKPVPESIVSMNGFSKSDIERISNIGCSRSEFVTTNSGKSMFKTWVFDVDKVIEKAPHLGPTFKQAIRTHQVNKLLTK